MDFSESELFRAQERLLEKRKKHKKIKREKEMMSLKTILENMPDCLKIGRYEKYKS